MKFIKNLIIVVILFLTSCSQHAIKTHAGINKHNISVGEAAVITVLARNITDQEVRVLRSYSFGTKNGESSDVISFALDKKYPGDAAIYRDYPSVNYRPSFETYQVNEQKELIFYFYPIASERGKGRLTLSLPDQFEPVKPFHVDIY